MKGKAVAPRVLASLIVAAAGSACHHRPPPPPEPVPVQTAVSETDRVPRTISAVGQASARLDVIVRPQVTGKLTAVLIEHGQQVKKGELLFQIDRRPLEAELSRARATLRKDIAEARNAETQARRYQELRAKNFVSQSDADQYRTAAASARGVVGADRAQVAQAALQLGYASIRSPIDGRTGLVLVDRGNLVEANTTQLVDIRRLDPIYVDFTVPSENLAEVQSEQARGPLEVSARPRGDPSAPPISGKLTFVDNHVDQATGTVLLRATVDNPDNILWPGEFLDVRLVLAVEKAVVVPSQAVQRGQKGTYVFVVKQDQTVEERAVTIGTRTDEDTVVKSGLRAGERVVTDGQLALSQGTRVRIERPAVATP